MFTKSLQKTAFRSPLAETQSLNESMSKSHSSSKKSMLAPILPLTSLIDAFCIIVIYLLIGTQTNSLPMDLPAHMTLPTADSGVALEESPIIRIEKGSYFINDKLVSTQQLGAELYQLKKSLKSDETQVIVQGDVKMNYSDLDVLIKAGSEAGIQKLKFAVISAK